jgi:hypothetical protein
MRRFFILLGICFVLILTLEAREYQKIVNGIYNFEYEESSDNGGKRLVKISGPVDEEGKPNGTWIGKVIDQNLMTRSRTVWNGTLQLTRGYKHGVPDGVYKFTDTRSYRYRKGGGGRRNELYSGTYKNGRPHSIWTISSPEHDNFKANLKYDNGVLISENMNENSPYPTIDYYMEGGEFVEYYRGVFCDGKKMDERPIFEKSKQELQKEAAWAEKERMESLQGKALTPFYQLNKRNINDSIYYVASHFLPSEQRDSVCNYFFAMLSLSALSNADSICLVYPKGRYFEDWQKNTEQSKQQVLCMQSSYDNFIDNVLPKIASKYPWINGSPNDFAGYVMHKNMTPNNARDIKKEFFSQLADSMLNTHLTKDKWELYARFHNVSSDTDPRLVSIFISDLIVIQANNGWYPSLDYDTIKSRYVKPAPNYNDGVPYLPKGELKVRNYYGRYSTISEYYKNRKTDVFEACRMIDLKDDFYYLSFDRSEKLSPEKWKKEWEKTWEKIVKKNPSADGFKIKR